MTDEELKNREIRNNLLKENGYRIANAINYANVLEQGNLDEVINKLNGLKASINSGSDVNAFGKGIAEKLEMVEEIINNDSYFKVNSNADAFVSIINSLKDKTVKNFQNCLRAEQILKNREENIKDIKKRIFAIEKNVELDDEARSDENSTLSEALVHAKKAKAEANEFYLEQKRISDEAMKNLDLVSYKNELLQMVNKLDDEYRHLSMAPESMEKIAEIIRDTRDSVVLFGIEAQKSKREFDELCLKSGLAKRNTLDKEKTEQQVIKEEKKEVKISTPQELVNEIKKLNPSVKIIETLNGEKRITVDNPSELKLPEGFKYDENLGINNKVDDLTSYIRVPVDTLTKKETIDNEKDIEPEVKEPEVKEPEFEEVRGSGKIPAGKKIKVVRSRRAVVAPYVQSMMAFGALGGVLTACSAITFTPVIAATIAGAGIGAIGQAIYTKMVRNGQAKVDNVHAYLNNPDYQMPTVGSVMLGNAEEMAAKIGKPIIDFGNKIKNRAKEMLNEYKENKNRKRDEELEEVMGEAVDPIIPETEKTPLEENFENSFANNLKNGLDELDEPVAGVDMLDDVLEGEHYGLDEVSRGGR